MTELLTESFCERCGTRYEFGAPEPLSTAQKTRGLVSGLRQFIMSQDTLSDSIGDAMRLEEEALAARQIEAFQEAFNFCLTCRRYNCQTCWNEGAGRCRTCEPIAGVDDFEALRTAALAAPPAEPAPPSPHRLSATSWPSEDRVAPSVPELELELPPLPAAAEIPPQVEPVLAETVPAAPQPVPEPVVEVEPEPVRQPEPLAAAAEPAASEPEPPSIVPPTPRRDLRDTFVRRPVRAPTRAPSPPESLAARRSQLDILGLEDPGEGTVTVGQRDALPYRSSGAGGAAVLASLWAASTRTLEAGAQRSALRECDACGLTVSATARFCRRCGAPQTLSA